MFLSSIGEINSIFKSVQSTLDDFTGFVGSEVSFDSVFKRNAFSNRDVGEIDYSIHALGDNHFEYNERICPSCGSYHVHKKDFRPRTFVKEVVGKITVYLRRYHCQKCNKWFRVNFDRFVKGFEKISYTLKDKIRKKSSTGRKSLRATSNDYLIDNIPISHTSINNILNLVNGNEIKFNVGELSGYYSFDEQHLKITANKQYKGQIKDVILNKTIAVKIYDSLNSENVEIFLRDNIPENKRFGITTDHETNYDKPIDNLGFLNHQKCYFHFKKIVHEAFKKGKKEKTYTEEEIKEIDEIQNRILYIFHTKDINTAYERLYYLLKDIETFTEFIQKFINKKLIKQWHNLIAFLIDPNIDKTSNKSEAGFSSTQRKEMKKIFKTVQGVLNYLKPIIEDQNRRLGLKKEENLSFYC